MKVWVGLSCCLALAVSALSQPFCDTHLAMRTKGRLAVPAEGSKSEEALREKTLRDRICSLREPFVENRGQISNAGIRYYASSSYASVFVTGDGAIIYTFPEFDEEGLVNGWVLRESFVGAKISEVKGQSETTTRLSYFRGKDPSEWKRDLPTFNLISLDEIYGGIELTLRVDRDKMEKVFYVTPNAEPTIISVKIDGALGLSVNDEGELEVQTDLGVIRFTRPTGYQEENCGKVYVDVAYRVSGNEYGFSIGDYDRNRPLIIDPLLASTFVGGNSGDYLEAMTLDSSGDIYVAGLTWSLDYPITPGAFDSTHYGAETDVFVSKLNGDLTELMASTFISGSARWDRARGVAVDRFGNVFITGYTESADFPTTSGAYDTTFDGTQDVFVSKLNGDLSDLLASTFIGGIYWEEAHAIAVNSSGDVYISGHTYYGYPTTVGAYDETHNGVSDVFVSKFDSDLSNLLASTYVGGDNWDVGFTALGLDISGNVYVSGWTWSNNYPTTPGAYDTDYNGGNTDVFVSKLNGDLTGLLASTFIGGSDYEEGTALSLDSFGHVYIAGDAYSSDYPTTPGAYDESHNGGTDVFVSKFDADLGSLLASTYIGGGYSDHAGDIVIDTLGGVFIVGYTPSPVFPTSSGGYDTTHNGMNDVFVSRLDTALTQLEAGTFIGGDDEENLLEPPLVALDSAGNVYVAGYTESTDFPTISGVYDESHNGEVDGFVAKLDRDLSAVVGIEEDGPLCAGFFVSQSEPNPFIHTTVIRYELSQTCSVQICIYNFLGQCVRTLLNSEQDRGIYTVAWDGMDDWDREVSAGSYFLRLSVDRQTITRKVCVVR